MSREEIQKLLGGYATDTLSETERRALVEAALEDQDLFDALAKEQALRDVLRSPSARQQLIEALGPARAPFAARAWPWLRRPTVLAMAGGMAALLIVGGLVLRQTKHAARKEALLADAIAPRTEPSDTALRNTPPPSTEHRKLLRLPAARRKAPAAPLPTPPVLQTESGAAPAKLPASAAATAAPAPTPSPRPATPPSGVLGGVVETERQYQMARAPVSSLNGRNVAPMAPMGLAKAAKSVAVKPAVEYTLLLKGADGDYSPVPAGAVFHAGDSLRVQVAPSEAGYIYLLQRADAAAGWNLVESRPVEKAQRYVLPSTGALQSDIPAQLELLVMFSRVEQPGFAAGRAGNLVDALVSKAQASSRIVIEFR
jgi:hypothetical protein